MTLPLDHIVIAVTDLEQTIADYAALGFQVLRGGDHPGRSSHNALVVFADGAYFELIAFKAPSPVERWWGQLDRHGEGIVDFALLPPDTAATVAAAARRGLALQGPLDGGRLRPDGERLRWQTARSATQDLPFLCGDLTPRALRVPEGEARAHANGALGVAAMTVAVFDLDATLQRWRALLGDASVGPAEASADGAIRTAVVRLGGTTLTLQSPLDAAAASHGLAGVLAKRLATRGEGPYAVVLRTADAARAGAALDPDLAHGASIVFEAP
ncbi:VOC family protein [Xylophilus sp. Kf1]|nr:VOC family protein [Xylophilus sp. Kf1]